MSQHLVRERFLLLSVLLLLLPFTTSRDGGPDAAEDTTSTRADWGATDEPMPHLEQPGGAFFVLPPGSQFRILEGDSTPRLNVVSAPTICLASDASCQAARALAAIPCTKLETCQPLQEYQRILGEPGIRPAPSPAHELRPEAEEVPSPR